MTLPNSIVFLVDVDDTLLENDHIQDDLKCHIEREFGPEAGTASGPFRNSGIGITLAPFSVFAWNTPTSATS
jgi:hypothetical protein